MAREYNQRSENTYKKNKRSNPYVLIVLSFLMGYLVSVIFPAGYLIQLINKSVFSKYSEQSKTKAIAETKSSVQLPKPKFEFYTLLSQEQQIKRKSNLSTQQINTTIASKPQSTSKLPTSTKKNISTENYILQVASFRLPQEAERMKVSLILKGFDVTVKEIKPSDGTKWYRVYIGPYLKRKSAEQARMGIVKNEKLNPIIRKVSDVS